MGTVLSMCTGQAHVHESNRLSVEIRSDFDQAGRVHLTEDEQTVPHYEQARARRRRRPGSILLPVLDPDLLRDGPPPDRYLTPVRIHPSGEVQKVPQQGDALVLQCDHDDDLRRVAVYREETDSRPHVLGLRPDGSETQRETISVPANWSGTTFRMHATTLAGTPRSLGPPREAAPKNPDNPSKSLYRTRSPGEVWMRLHHRRDDAQNAQNDIALFRIAPLVLQSNLEPVRRLYVTSEWSNHNFVYDVMEACWTAFGEPGPFDRDFGRPFPSSTSRSPDPPNEAQTINTPSATSSGACLLTPNRMYLIDGTRYRSLWPQDQMATGYCSAPGEGRAFNVVLHCKRTSSLSNFVTNELPDAEDGLFVFNGLVQTNSNHQTVEKDQTDLGGNIAVSPPVMKETSDQPRTNAGPPVPAHPPAPHGKIILGDCRNEKRRIHMKGNHDGTPHEETRNFLRAQEVQPMVPLDTSWLAAGHVDEIMTFVPNPNAPDNRSAKMVMASPSIMNQLLQKTMRVSVENGRTHFHRGREIRPIPSSREGYFKGNYDEKSVEAFYNGKIREVSMEIQNQFLTPIRNRLCHCTGLDRSTDVLPLPVYFTPTHPQQYEFKSKEKPGLSWGDALATARTSNLVNMQVLKTDQGAHLLVPRPCGPRLPPPDARRVVQEVLSEIQTTNTDVYLPQDRQDDQPGFPFWARPNLEARTLALFLTHAKPEGGFITAEDRNRIIEVIENPGTSFNTLPPHLKRAVEHTKQQILEANGGQAKEIVDHEGKSVPLLNQEEKFNSWHRLFIPEDTVDVLEAYTQSVLKGIGCEVHFVDAWLYHIHKGEVHCGTEVLHEPPTAESLRQDGRCPWWESPTLDKR